MFGFEGKNEGQFKENPRSNRSMTFLPSLPEAAWPVAKPGEFLSALGFVDG